MVPVNETHLFQYFSRSQLEYLIYESFLWFDTSFYVQLTERKTRIVGDACDFAQVFSYTGVGGACDLVHVFISLSATLHSTDVMVNSHDRLLVIRACDLSSWTARDDDVGLAA